MSDLTSIGRWVNAQRQHLRMSPFDALNEKVALRTGERPRWAQLTSATSIPFGLLTGLHTIRHQLRDKDLIVL